MTPYYQNKALDTKERTHSEEWAPKITHKVIILLGDEVEGQHIVCFHL